MHCIPLRPNALARPPFCTALEMAVSAAEVEAVGVSMLTWACTAPLLDWLSLLPAVARGETEKEGELAALERSCTIQHASEAAASYSCFGKGLHFQKGPCSYEDLACHSASFDPPIVISLTLKISAWCQISLALFNLCNASSVV